MKRIMCVVENSVQQGSLLWGEHGVAYLIKTENGCVLFDTGQSGSVLLHNLALFDETLANIDGLVLSHAHMDHTGGLTAVLSGKSHLPIYGSPDIFRPRYSVRGNKANSIGLHTTEWELAQVADLRLDERPVEVLEGVWSTGEIYERPELEGRSTNHFVRDQGQWQPDLYRDDVSVVVEVEEGVVVICGCCHAGLLNTLAHIRRTFGKPIAAVLGGTHLTGASESYLQHVVETLGEVYGPPQFYLNHCTGQQAYVALARAFSTRVQPLPAGTIIDFV